MKKYFKKHLFIFLGFIVGSVLFTGIKFFIFAPKVTKVSQTEKEIIVEGKNLGEIKNAYLIDGGLKAKLKIKRLKDETNKISLIPFEEIKLVFKKIPHLILESAYGAVSYPIEIQITSGSEIKDNSIESIKIHQMSATDSQTLKWNDVIKEWEASTDIGIGEGGGTVTSITPGTGFTSATAITVSGTLNINTGSTANKILVLDSSGNIPAISGVNLTSLPSDVSIDNLSLISHPAISLKQKTNSAGGTRSVRFYEKVSSGSHSFSFKAPDSLTQNVTWTLPYNDTTEDKFLVLNATGDLVLLSYPEIFNYELDAHDFSDFTTEVQLYYLKTQVCISSDVLADFPTVFEIKGTSTNDNYIQVYYDPGGGTSFPDDSKGPILIPGKYLHIKSLSRQNPSSRAVAANTYNDLWDGTNSYVHPGGNLKCLYPITQNAWPGGEVVTSDSLQNFQIRGWR